MNKPTLISITGDVLDLQKILEENGGELPVELEMKMSEVLAEDKKKITAYTNILSSYDSEITFVQERVREAKEYIQRLEKMKDKLLEIAKYAIHLRGENLEGDYGRRIFLRKSTRVEVDVPPESLPPECTTLTITPNKIILKGLLQEGAQIEGVKLVESESVLWK